MYLGFTLTVEPLMQLLLLFEDQKEYVLNKLRVFGDNSENPVHFTLWLRRLSHSPDEANSAEVLKCARLFVMLAFTIHRERLAGLKTFAISAL